MLSGHISCRHVVGAGGAIVPAGEGEQYVLQSGVSNHSAVQYYRQVAAVAGTWLLLVAASYSLCTTLQYNRVSLLPVVMLVVLFKRADDTVDDFND